MTGSPFSILGTFGNSGGGVALTPNGQFLYALAPATSNITIFQVNPDCSLWRFPMPVNTRQNPVDINVSPNGLCLAVTSPDDFIRMYDLSQGPESPRLVDDFRVSGPGVAAGVEFSSRLGVSKLYIGKDYDQGAVVAHFTLNQGCRLTDGGFTPATGGGINSNVVKLTPMENCLFVTNQDSDSITTFQVNFADGQLTEHSSSPFPTESPLPTAAVFALTHDLGSVFYTTTFNPPQVVRHSVTGCELSQLDVVSTGVPTGRLKRCLAVAQNPIVE